MKLITTIVLAGCLCLCGCFSKNKEAETLPVYTLPNCDKGSTAPKLMTIREGYSHFITNSPGYKEGDEYEVFRDGQTVTFRKAKKQFMKFSQDLSRENTKKVSIKFRAKKSSTAKADALLQVRLLIGNEGVFHLNKDPYEFSTTDTWEDLQYDFSVSINSNYRVAIIQIYTLAIEPESIMVDDVVVEIEKSNQGMDLTVAVAQQF